MSGTWAATPDVPFCIAPVMATAVLSVASF
jgi:hypothetical protein